MNAAKRKPRREDRDGISYRDLDPALCVLMRGPKPTASFISDGCTSSPDEWGGADLRPACHWHDYHYRVEGGNERSRKQADHNLFYNLRACGLPYLWAQLYYRRVRFWGVRHFKYRPCRAKPGLLRRCVLFFSRWLTF